MNDLIDFLNQRINALVETLSSKQDELDELGKKYNELKTKYEQR